MDTGNPIAHITILNHTSLIGLHARYKSTQAFLHFKCGSTLSTTTNSFDSITRMLCSCVCTGCERCQNSQSPEWASLITTICGSCYCRQCTRSRCIVLRQNQFLTSWWQIFTYLNSRIVHNNFENIMIFIVSPYSIVIKTFCFTLECRSLKIYDLNYWIKEDSSHKLKNHVSSKFFHA